MSAEDEDGLTVEEPALFGAYLNRDLALRSRQVRELNVSVSADALKMVVNHLMTEFWDQGFSQAEIRDAFLDAVADINRYSAGQERRGEGEP